MLDSTSPTPNARQLGEQMLRYHDRPQGLAFTDPNVGLIAPDHASFRRLDRDRDGLLDAAEIGLRLNERYGDQELGERLVRLERGAAVFAGLGWLGSSVLFGAAGLGIASCLPGGAGLFAFLCCVLPLPILFTGFLTSLVRKSAMLQFLEHAVRVRPEEAVAAVAAGDERGAPGTRPSLPARPTVVGSTPAGAPIMSEGPVAIEVFGTEREKLVAARLRAHEDGLEQIVIRRASTYVMLTSRKFTAVGAPMPRVGEQVHFDNPRGVRDVPLSGVIVHYDQT